MLHRIPNSLLPFPLIQNHQDIASLLQHTSDALRSIAKPPEPDTSDNEDFNQSSTDSAVSNFKAAQSEFISTLDRIDKQLKRHIYALEEAGVITLRGSSDPQQGTEGGGGGVAITAPTGDGAGAGGSSGRGKEITARLDPDGVGRYGSLDAGQLNMASSTVERDLESALWARAREYIGEMMAERASEADQMQE